MLLSKGKKQRQQLGSTPFFDNAGLKLSLNNMEICRCFDGQERSNYYPRIFASTNKCGYVVVLISVCLSVCSQSRQAIRMTYQVKEDKGIHYKHFIIYLKIYNFQFVNVVLCWLTNEQKESVNNCPKVLSSEDYDTITVS